MRDQRNPYKQEAGARAIAAGEKPAKKARFVTRHTP